MTNIAICGANGKMGRVIYDCVSNRSDCKIIAGIDINTEKGNVIRKVIVNNI